MRRDRQRFVGWVMKLKRSDSSSSLPVARGRYYNSSLGSFPLAGFAIQITPTGVVIGDTGRPLGHVAVEALLAIERSSLPSRGRWIAAAKLALSISHPQMNLIDLQLNRTPVSTRPCLRQRRCTTYLGKAQHCAN
jgi:hypothetical protein